MSPAALKEIELSQNYDELFEKCQELLTENSDLLELNKLYKSENKRLRWLNNLNFEQYRIDTPVIE